MTLLRHRCIQILCAAVIGVAALAGCGDGERDRRRTPKATASAEGTFAELAPDVYEPCGLTGASGALWVLACSGKLVRVPDDGSARTSRAIADDTVGLDGLAGDGNEALWALLATGTGAERRGAVRRFEATSGTTIATIDLGASIPAHAVVTGRTLWVGASDGSLFSVEGNEARRIAGGSPLMWVLADSGRLWTVTEDGAVGERDPRGRTVRTVEDVTLNPIAAAAGLNSLWLASAERGLVRLDTTTGNTSSVRVSGTVNDIEPCGTSVWLSQPDFGLRSLDAEGDVVRSVELSPGARYLLCDGDRLWILTEDGRLGSIDPTG